MRSTGTEMNRHDRRAASRKAAVASAMSVAQDITTGKLDPDQLEAEAVKACREVTGSVIGPEDPLWPLQVEICRDVLGAGGAISADELYEWSVVERGREAPAPSWIEQALATGAGDDEESGESEGE